jgi:hypothetical protein
VEVKVKTLKYYMQGIKEASQQSKMIALLWFMNFLFGWVLYRLFSNLISGFLGNSVITNDLLKEFDYRVVIELIIHEPGRLQTILSVASILIIFYFLVSIFLDGGILFRLLRYRSFVQGIGERASFASDFFHGAGKFFGRFFRLYIYSLIFWIVFVIILMLTWSIISALTNESSMEVYGFYIFLGVVIFGFFLFALIRMIMDYARIKIAVEDNPQVFKSLFSGLSFVFKNFGKTLLLYYLMILTAVLCFGIFWILNWLIPSRALITILIVFVIQQLFIASRGWLRIAVLSGQSALYSFYR